MREFLPVLEAAAQKGAPLLVARYRIGVALRLHGEASRVDIGGQRVGPPGRKRITETNGVGRQGAAYTAGETVKKIGSP